MRTNSTINGWQVVSEWYGNGRVTYRWSVAKRLSRGCGRLWFVYHPDCPSFAIGASGWSRKQAEEFCRSRKP